MAKKTAKPVLLSALKRAIPAIKDDSEMTLIRFSIAENGNLMLSGGTPEKGSCSEEIPEALVVKPGGPGLFSGDFGVVNLSSEPFDFEIDALALMPALKKSNTDPSILFYGRKKAVEFRWPDFQVYLSQQGDN
jgi:hypothetical protein